VGDHDDAGRDRDEDVRQQQAAADGRGKPAAAPDVIRGVGQERDANGFDDQEAGQDEDGDDRRDDRVAFHAMNPSRQVG
jgi:hypothetical protein